VNLFWAIERMKRVAERHLDAGPRGVADALIREAAAMKEEDVRANRAMGVFGAELVPDTAAILTHCNAGALATAGYGTALGVVRAAVEAGKKVRVLADETRPFLQGARLTAWELHQDRIPVKVITDGMAGHFMRRGEVDLVVVGADRIAMNGDVANKIGTYQVAVLARENDVPFYVAAPISTLDPARPGCGERRRHPDRGARPAGGDVARRDAARAGGGRGGAPCVRRDPASLRRGDHHRARRGAAAVHREPASAARSSGHLDGTAELRR